MDQNQTKWSVTADLT